MTFNELMDNPWVDAGVSVLIFVLVAILARVLINLIVGRIISRITARTKTSLDDFLVKAVRSPLYWLLVTIALEFSPQSVIGGATHYHANYVEPSWAKKKRRVRSIGRHVFYVSEGA